MYVVIITKLASTSCQSLEINTLYSVTVSFSAFNGKLATTTFLLTSLGYAALPREA